MDLFIIGYYIYLFATGNAFLETAPFWTFCFWFYLFCISASLAILLICYTVPGTSITVKDKFLEQEEKSSAITLFYDYVSPVIIISLFLLTGAFKLVFVYFLFTGLYYLIRYVALNEF